MAVFAIITLMRLSAPAPTYIIPQALPGRLRIQTPHHRRHEIAIITESPRETGQFAQTSFTLRKSEIQYNGSLLLSQQAALPARSHQYFQHLERGRQDDRGKNPDGV